MIEFLETELPYADGSYVFPGWSYDNAFGGFPNQWDAIFKGSVLDGVTAHVLRHSFASLANDLGYTEITIAALIGHSKGTMTSKYVHTRAFAPALQTDMPNCATLAVSANY